MDEYSPEKVDLAELSFLCEELLQQALDSLDKGSTVWHNDLISTKSVDLNVLIEHIMDFSWKFKIKYPDKHVINTLIEEYLEETYRLFGNTSISYSDINNWKELNQSLLTLIAQNPKSYIK
ncbi:Hha toxicity modulator TomB [Proteus vulgaris]|uniref:Hha toxicity modulator TomB n=1 Tax=Proteus faecis TaxID=2050967 RepID=UPI00163C3C44|nr:Hha toxicity modulator TomB [Proteus faecis]MCT8248871.1 Hha toxicity modulator TomB [Proteus faecis]QNH66375.1 Hha toxicity modulator TomB [Proteus vulgaris]